jgi:hypothetical protein
MRLNTYVEKMFLHFQNLLIVIKPMSPHTNYSFNSNCSSSNFEKRKTLMLLITLISYYTLLMLIMVTVSAPSA